MKPRPTIRGAWFPVRDSVIFQYGHDMRAGAPVSGLGDDVAVVSPGPTVAEPVAV